MRTVNKKRLLALSLCLLLAVPSAAVAASFGEIAGGVKTLTEAGKDVHSMSNDKEQKSDMKQEKKREAKKTPPRQAKKQSSSRKAAPNTEHERGG